MEKKPFDFASWDRQTLDEFAATVYNELVQTQEDLKMALDAYRKEVVKNEKLGKTPRP
jgi:hypothetical protein